VLRVSEAQYAALEAYFGDEFAERMTTILFSSFPAECKPKGRKRVLAFVCASIDRARSLGATLESDFQRFVVTEFVAGVADMKAMLEVQRKRLLERDGFAHPTLLIFLTYQAMLGRFTDDDPPQSEDPVFEPVEDDVDEEAAS